MTGAAKQSRLPASTTYSWPGHLAEHQMPIVFEHAARDPNFGNQHISFPPEQYAIAPTERTHGGTSAVPWQAVGGHGWVQPFGSSTMGDGERNYVVEPASVPALGADVDDMGIPLGFEQEGLDNGTWRLHENSSRGQSALTLSTVPTTHSTSIAMPHQHAYENAPQLAQLPILGSGNTPYTGPQHNATTTMSMAISPGSLTNSPWSWVPSAPTSHRGHSSDREADWVQVNAVPTSQQDLQNASPPLKYELTNPFALHPVIPLAVVSAPTRQRTRKPQNGLTRKEKSKTGKRNKPLKPEARNRAHRNRQDGTCFRCWRAKCACDQNPEGCHTCRSIQPNARIYKEPCLRFKWDDFSLVRNSNARMHQKRVTYLPFLFRTEPKAHIPVSIEWNLPGSGRVPNARAIEVRMGEYASHTITGLETTTYRWRSIVGHYHEIKTPCYAVSDTKTLQRRVRQYLIDNQPALEEEGIKTSFKTDQSLQGSIVERTYLEALRYRTKHESSLLDKALLMHCGSIMSQGFGSIVSDKVPKVEEVDCECCTHCVYPAYNRGRGDWLPQAMGHQFDVAILKNIKEVEQEFFKDFKKLLRKSKLQSPYYELFLAWIMTLCNVAYIYSSAEEYRWSKMNTAQGKDVDDVVTYQTERWEHTATFLVKIFPSVLRQPLQTAFDLARRGEKQKLMSEMKIDEEAVEYLQEIVALLDHGEAPLRTPTIFVRPRQNEKATQWISRILSAAHSEEFN